MRADQFRMEKSLEPARRALTDATGAAAWMAGWAMPIENAIREAMGSDGSD
jgi:hypothetical protein